MSLCTRKHLSMDRSLGLKICCWYKWRTNYYSFEARRSRTGTDWKCRIKKKATWLFESLGIMWCLVGLQFRPLFSLEWFLSVNQNKSDQILFKIWTLTNILVINSHSIITWKQEAFQRYCINISKYFSFL